MVILLPRHYWSLRCTVTWDCKRQQLTCPHNSAWITPEVVSQEPLSIAAGRGELEPLRSCAFPVWPHSSSVLSWFLSSSPKTRISSPPIITHLPSDRDSLDIFAACFATLICQTLVLTHFPMSCLSNCITTLLWPLWGHILFMHLIEQCYQMLQP